MVTNFLIRKCNHLNVLKSKRVMKNLSDVDIIESVRKGNHSDFSVLIDRYKDKAFSLLCRMLKNNMEAEEVLQDCFLKAFNGLAGFKNNSKFSTWFYSIVYNTALTKLSGKKRKIENEMSSIDDHLNLKNEIDIISIEAEEMHSAIYKMIDKLPEKFAGVITMFYLNEMSCEEISSAMNTSVSNVKVLLYRSRNALKEIAVKYNLQEELL